MNTASSFTPEPVFSPQAAVLAWLWPGLGHISLGERKRGLYIMIGVLFLYFCGTLIGGLDTVDRRSDRLWFYAQAVCGPLAFGTDWMTQKYVKLVPANELNARFQQGDLDAIKTTRRTSLGKVNEIGTLFCALAGLMNLIVILDALHFHPRPSRSTGEASSDATGEEGNQV